MFENEIEILKNEINKMLDENIKISSLLVENNVKKKTVEKLVEIRSDMEKDKKITITILVSSGVAIALAFGAVLWLTSLSFLSSLALTIISGIASGMINLYNLIGYIQDKSKYKKLATDENLELEKNYQDIISKGVKLNKQSNSLQDKLKAYLDVVGYLIKYDEMMAFLESIKEEKRNELNNLFNEYLEEKVDYSQVHLNDYSMPERVQLKKLTK